MTTETLEFIKRAKVRIAELGATIVDTDGDLTGLTILLDLSDFLETLHTTDHGLSTYQIERTVHGLSDRANLREIPSAAIAGFDTNIILGDTGGGMTFYPIATINNNGLMSSEHVRKLESLGTFKENITVSLSNGKTLGRYTTGEVIPSSGKTYEEVMFMIAQEAINPSVSLVLTPTQYEYNEINTSTKVNWNIAVESLGAFLKYVKLERSRDNANWTPLLEQGQILASSVGTLTDLNNATVDNRTLYYRLTAEDTAGGRTVVTRSTTFKAYVYPTTVTSVGEEQRELGNISTNFTATITRNSPNIPLISAQAQYSNQGGDWVSFGALHNLAAAGGSIATGHNQASLLNTTRISYRYEVKDSEGTFYTPIRIVDFYHPRHFGYSSNGNLSAEALVMLTQIGIGNTRTFTKTGVTATGGSYTYYVYAQAGGDLNNVIMDGAAPVLGAFTKLADITTTNEFGATVKLRVYRSNAVNAFTNNSLAFS